MSLFKSLLISSGKSYPFRLVLLLSARHPVSGTSDEPVDSPVLRSTRHLWPGRPARPRGRLAGGGAAAGGGERGDRPAELDRRGIRVVLRRAPGLETDAVLVVPPPRAGGGR